ncbi:hypothetical protein ACFXQA_11915 [Microbacterium sp. P07]|uniref:hypothetical protein n=1 Tax=Microbacterium sp. P07 TaxID=3366952 RepID=UPI00374662F9
MNARHVAAAVLVAVAVSVSGCAAPPEPAEPTPTFATEEEAFAAAEQTYRAYVDALNQVDLSDPETFEPVFALTTGDLHSSDRKGLTAYHADEVSLSGVSKLSLLERKTADLEAGVVTFAVCLDVSTIALTSSDGQALVDPDRVAVQSLLVSLKRTEAAEPSFRVGSISGREGAPQCV